MTRDEAIRIAEGIWGLGQSDKDVDMLVALGVLKLDEPKSAPRDTLNDVWCLIPPGCRTIPNLLMVMEKAGLKIVEK